MFPLTVEQLCQVTGGLATGSANPDDVVRNVVIDSRLAGPGSAFFALQGNQVHGMNFADDAVARGAVVVVLDGRFSESITSADGSGPATVLVPCATAALAQLAVRNRRYSEALVLGITGSVGKTTTRRMIFAVLEAAFRGVQSPRNFNNELGVPLSLLQLSAGDEFAVIEMAAAGSGEISELAGIARPDFAVVTRITPAHLDGFGSLKSVQQTKSELVRALTADGTAILNADDPLVRQMADLTKANVVLFGESADASVRAESVHVENSKLSVTVGSETFAVPASGRHHLTSLLAAIAVGRELGLSSQQINLGLSRYVPESGRCCVLEVGSWTVIDDTYNASPASVAAAADLLQHWSTSARRLLVLGDMLELGDQAEEFHFSVGARLAQASIDHVLVFGSHATDTAEGFLESGGRPGGISVFEDVSTLLAILDVQLSPGDVVLVKGSRSLQMERVIAALRAAHEQQPATIAMKRPAANTVHSAPPEFDDTYTARRA
ncbi:MAG: UDP-N-acetylmuramoyl-tripeptide--D-alanyl-D-alanine ligase [Planctomycetaceae bacterium]